LNQNNAKNILELNACGFRLSEKVRDFVLSKVEG
jgi:hypothetical protein